MTPYSGPRVVKKHIIACTIIETESAITDNKATETAKHY